MFLAGMIVGGIVMLVWSNSDSPVYKQLQDYFNLNKR